METMVNIKSSLSDKIDSTRAGIMQDAKVFDIDYLPEELIEREVTKELFNYITSFVHYGTVNNILLTGCPGTGKTITARVTQIIVSQRGVEAFYVNCKDKKVNDVLSSLMKPNEFRELRIGDDILQKILSSIKKDKVLIILDEIDKSPSSKELLYDLSRVKEVYPEIPLRISLLLISNHPMWDSTLDSYIRSSLQLIKLEFKPYSENELYQILQNRVNVGFLPEVITNDQIKDLAKWTCQEREGDTRVAMKALQRAGIIAEQQRSRKVENSHIEKAKEQAIRINELLRLTGLTDNQFFVLYTAKQEASSFSEFAQKYAETAYSFSRGKVIPLKRSAIQQTLAYLDNLYLIKTEILLEKRGDNIPPLRRLKITPRIESSILEEELSKRIPSIEHKKVKTEHSRKSR